METYVLHIVNKAVVHLADTDRRLGSKRTSPLGAFFYEGRDLDVHLEHKYGGLQQPKVPRADLSEEVTVGIGGEDTAKGSGVFYFSDLPAGVANTRVVAVCPPVPG